MTLHFYDCPVCGKSHSLDTLPRKCLDHALHDHQLACGTLSSFIHTKPDCQLKVLQEVKGSIPMVVLPTFIWKRILVRLGQKEAIHVLQEVGLSEDSAKMEFEGILVSIISD